MDIISEYVPLRPAGKAFKGPCSFHDDKGESFTVNRDMQVYKCFACGEGGNVFAFLMKYKDMKFHEVVRFLAEELGMDYDRGQIWSLASQVHRKKANRVTSVEIREVGAESLPLYATIPASFMAESEFRIELVDSGLGGFRFIEEKVTPYLKYDEDDDDVLNWPKQYDVSKWGIFIAFDGDRPVAGAIVAIDMPAGMTTPFESEGIAILWDLRVHPDERRRGVGAEIFKCAADWAREKGCKQFKIETQNVNVPACRFYVKQGCKLGATHRYGYAGCSDVAHEAMLLWYLEL